jgi:hypothetical protein
MVAFGEASARHNPRGEHAEMIHQSLRHGLVALCLALAPTGAIAQLCVIGSYSATGSAPCVLAPAGSYVPTSGATSATLADPGYFVGAAGQGAETPAPAGSYASGTGNTSATLASPGS